MTHQMDLVRVWTNLPTKSVAESAVYLAEEFQSLDKEGNVIMNKETWSNFYSMLLAAFTDYRYIRTELRQHGNYVIMSGYFEGTHIGDLDLTAMGMDVIPASDRKIVWPKTSSKITVNGSQVLKIEPYGLSPGGMDAFLAPIMSAA